jgi:hypothetical protein
MPSIPNVRMVSNAADTRGLIGDIGKVVDNATPKLNDNMDFVAAHFNAALHGQLPDAAAQKKLAEQGIDFSKVIDETKVAAGNSFDRLSNMARQVWSGLYLKFEDATFPMRLRGALNDQNNAIESMTFAIQQYTRTISEGTDSIKALEVGIQKYAKELAAAEKAGDSATVTRINALMQGNSKAIDANKKIIADMTTAKTALEREQRLLRVQWEQNTQEAERLLHARELDKDLSKLDDKLRGSLNKFTNLQSDVARINQNVQIHAQQAQKAAEQLVDSGGLHSVHA